MDILNAEEKLAAWLEETVEMPGAVCRGVLPRGRKEGFEINLVSGMPAGMNRVNEFTLEVKGFLRDRRELWRCFDRIFAALPLEKYDSFLYVDVTDEVSFSAEEKEGLQVSCGTVKLTASFV
ncbi:MAG: hypothetical protein IKD44_12315 [Lentisphaeria bacterium]|nr:hypothetical protein [Lentisphaeria bacterium]